MCEYIDVGQIVHFLPDLSNPSASTKIEIDVCLAQEDVIKSGVTKKVRSSVGIYNIPESHYVEFKGVHTNLGIFTKESVLKNDTFGYLYVYVHNASIEKHTLPFQMKLGYLSIKPYADFTATDWVDEIYMHGGSKHVCSTSCNH